MGLRAGSKGSPWSLLWVLAGVILAQDACSGGKYFGDSTQTSGRSGNGSCSSDSDCSTSAGTVTAAGVKCCSGTCRDLTKDVNNCGACGTTCPPDGACLSNGAGKPGTCSCSQSLGTGCPTGQVCCGDAVNSDTGYRPTCVSIGPLNCGSCNHQCGSRACCTGGGRVECVNESPHNCGACGTACTGSDQCCNGACADTITDCGQCGNACPPGEFCQQTQDGSSCAPLPAPDGGPDASADAAVDAADPCENVTCTGTTCCSLGGIADCVDLNTDKLNCGACNAVCPAGEVCVAKLCVPAEAAAPDAACLQPGVFCGQAENACCSGVCGTYGETQNLCCSPSQTPCTQGVNSAGSCCQYQATSPGGTPLGTDLWCQAGDGGTSRCCVTSSNQTGPVCLTSADCCDGYLSCTQTSSGPHCCNGGNQPCRSDGDCCLGGSGSGYGHCNAGPTGAMICCAGKDQSCDGQTVCCGSLTCQFVGSIYLCE